MDKRSRAARAHRFLRWGVAKLVKAPDFDSGIRRFESFLPSHSSQRAGRGIAPGLPTFAEEPVDGL
jgi:hypothetical protein